MHEKPLLSVQIFIKNYLHCVLLTQSILFLTLASSYLLRILNYKSYS